MNRSILLGVFCAVLVACGDDGAFITVELTGSAQLAERCPRLEVKVIDVDLADVIAQETSVILGLPHVLRLEPSDTSSNPLRLGVELSSVEATCAAVVLDVEWEQGVETRTVVELTDLAREEQGSEGEG